MKKSVLGQKNRGPGPLGPSPKSATAIHDLFLCCLNFLGHVIDFCYYEKTSGSSAAVPIYTPTILLAKPPDPLNVENRSH